MSKSTQALQGLIKGRVQGVFFRLETLHQAQNLGLVGWVRNTSEGHVEVYLCGEELKLQDMLLWLKRGPTLAKVLSVELNPVEVSNLPDFQILP